MARDEPGKDVPTCLGERQFGTICQHGAAVVRWDNEGGARTPSEEEDSRAAAVHLGQQARGRKSAEGGGAPQDWSEEEEDILRRLGGAVIVQWNDLPTDIQRKLFEQTVSIGDQHHTAQLKEQVARFLHKYKTQKPGAD
jgi:hypothetical protein